MPWIADRYRLLVYNAFNPTIRDAANFLYKYFEMEMLSKFHYIFSNCELNRHNYDDYVGSVGDQYMGSDFDADRVLIACVKITKIGLKFHRHGFKEAPPLITQYIINILDNYDMANGGWEQLNSVAANYARLYADMDKPLESLEYEVESGSVINNSESNFSEVSTQEAASNSKASTSEVTSTRNDVPSTSAQWSSKSGLAFNFDVLETPSSSGEAKPSGVQRDIGSPDSVPMDGTEEYDSDVFEGSLEAVPP